MGRPRKLTPEQEREIVSWYLEHCSVKEKARRMGISDTSLYGVLSRHGVTNREGKTCYGYQQEKERQYFREASCST